ncbi:NAD(P)-dependent oxidoreductase [Streptomyces qinzhouensis]|uniref:NAD(P)-dependent oxidoreductase n=1 Tax=Streptomyces qinzhouensis TaxID=2599401 RepID=A0A5B8J8D9_9ACTN|nr:NAD(P)-dependent oxidoreductase [Streptomyces qinzhouensis]QDY76161.1 NAD(P)-dependent oxidoreductase [Streptomyces qinzhouensis]
MTSYRLSGAVMTHPKRLAAAEQLAGAAPPGALRVVMDPDPGGRPSALRTALAAWSAIEEDATHHLVVQDDMLLSDSFFERAGAAVAAMPHAALALFALWDSRNGAAVRFGALAGARWVSAVNEYFPCVAIVLPRDAAAGFVDYGRARLDAWPDDILMYRFMRDNGIPGYVSVPSLAEHEDQGSISGNAFRGPRRSVCFLPGDRPADEDVRLSGLRVAPFFKNGVAQCAVRVEEPGPERWLHLECESFLEGSGIRGERLDSAMLGLTEVTDREAVRGTWLTAFALGFVHRRDGRGEAPDPARDPVLAEALATIGPGGISHRSSEERIAEVRDELAAVAEAGLTAGLAAGERRPARRPAAASPAGPVTAPAVAAGTVTARTVTARTAAVSTVAVGLAGGSSPLGEHIARGLADKGFTVTPAGPGTEGPPRGLDALVDLRPLHRAGGRAPAEIALRILDRATGAVRTTHTLYPGDLYGPGCPRDSVIGALVWDALRYQPLKVTEPPEAGPRPLYPLHTADLTDALAHALVSPPAERAVLLPVDEPLPVRAVAELVREAVRPVPLEGVPAARRRSAGPGPVPRAPRLPGWKPVRELRQGLHGFAQWLAYEGIRHAPV